MTCNLEQALLTKKKQITSTQDKNIHKNSQPHYRQNQESLHLLPPRCSMDGRQSSECTEITLIILQICNNIRMINQVKHKAEKLCAQALLFNNTIHLLLLNGQNKMILDFGGTINQWLASIVLINQASFLKITPSSARLSMSQFYKTKKLTGSKRQSPRWN